MRLFAFFLFASLLVGQPTESTVLGGACLPETKLMVPELQAWHEKVTAYNAASAKGDRAGALGIAMQLVRARCSNEHWRFVLIESLVSLNRMEDALALLAAFQQRGSNNVEERLGEPSAGLKKLMESEAYRKSSFAAKRHADQAAGEQRLAEARARLPKVVGPPKDYVAKGSCPFECCRYGKWTATQKTILYDKPGGNVVVGELGKGARVDALTGEVHLTPVPVLVRYGTPYGFRAPVGSIVFLLDRSGEGHGKVWVNGKTFDSEHMYVQGSCRTPGSECWGEFLVEDAAKRDGAAEWWVQIRTREGKVGWTRQADHFDDRDSCG